MRASASKPNASDCRIAINQAQAMESLYQPVTDPDEIGALLSGLPIVIEPEKFVDFVLGFPRRYLQQTSAVEVVKHFLLTEKIGPSGVISSLTKIKSEWKLNVLTRDRRFLFSRIAGVLSYFGADIRTAEAFANRRQLVLDTFYFSDVEADFENPQKRQQFQALLEEVIHGGKDIRALLNEARPDFAQWRIEELGMEFDNALHPDATRLRLSCKDHFGLLYLLSDFLSCEGFDIEMADVYTENGLARDDFFLTREGRKLTDEQQEDLVRRFRALANRAVTHAAHR